ncbi:hypothetical protein A2Z23_00715 [Candidatus Curtissbacteria bacterium RBG_16_39_7]|uniref:Vitamin B12-dependent ribonucleotide reductase n=1 Tax=Candidatus Curtissbacteria bacterium RBG_16_39_7 TaxID=1797707 RepID=A0A1F5G1N5_9BACT|nr:MAG: hypothetical protein A2Z23_00715 [Candidatus Curtissbacteria bacterium RBG_16_39_7]
MNQFPLPEIEEMTLGNRKIGLGLMGFADMLVQLGIAYDSEKALEVAEKVAEFVREEARKASQDLAEERGVFPNYDGSIFDSASPYFKGLPLALRNATLTTIAPTGTTSMLADVNGGIEPFFALSYDKNTVKGKVPTLNRYFIKIAKEKGFWSEELIAKIKANSGSVRGLKEVPKDIQRLFPIASEISPEWHIRVQAAFQKHVDNAISKTINMPENATPEDILKAYHLAYELGCKGVTIYREGSREKQILERKKARPEPVRERLPDERRAVVHKFEIGDSEGYIMVGLYEDGRPGEVFIQMAKEGSTVSGLIDWAAVLTSVALQYGVPLADLARKFRNTRFEPMGRTNNPRIRSATSIPDYVYRWLEEKFVPEDQRGNGKNGQKLDSKETETNHESSGLGCPDCGQVLVYQEGCQKCTSCGFEKCG